MNSLNHFNAVKSAAEKFLPKDYDPRLYYSQIWQESRLNASAVSPAGAKGAAQIMPNTWHDWAKQAGHQHSDPFGFVASVDVGACYLNWLWGQWSAPRPSFDRLCLAMASYNAGLGNILTAQRLANNANGYKEIMERLNDVTGPRNSWETISYVRNIWNKYLELSL